MKEKGKWLTAIGLLLLLGYLGWKVLEATPPDCASSLEEAEKSLDARTEAYRRIAATGERGKLDTPQKRRLRSELKRASECYGEWLDYLKIDLSFLTRCRVERSGQNLSLETELYGPLSRLRRIEIRLGEQGPMALFNATDRVDPVPPTAFALVDGEKIANSGVDALDDVTLKGWMLSHRSRSHSEEQKILLTWILRSPGHSAPTLRWRYLTTDGRHSPWFSCREEKNPTVNRR